MKVAIVGAGYVGLVSGACFAEFGHQVTCIDNAAEKIELLRQGEIPIYEPSLGEIVKSNSAAGRLSFTTEMATPIANADIVFIAVGTPSRRGDGHADLTYVYAAAAEIAQHLNGFTVVATKSTVPVGTGDEVERIIKEANPNADFVVASNPEFLREGAAIDDFKRPDRIVVGIEDERARAPISELYRPLYLNKGPLIFTSRRTAELIKYASNSFLAMKITFINEMADLSEAVGANVQDVARVIGLDKRIGSKFLHSGPGFGGSCFPKDASALVQTANDFGQSLNLVETTIAVNNKRKRGMAKKIIAALDGDVRDKTICLLGLTFKPNTDDMREAPSLAIAQALVDAGAHLKAFDPQGMEQAKREMPFIDYQKDAYAAANGADAVVIVTEWNQFRALDLARLKAEMHQPVLIDLRNIYRREEVEPLGFTYRCVGRPDQEVG
jgi:UDPglucose 6-dehydrogenase